MLISEARSITGAEKCEDVSLGAITECCETKLLRGNTINYIRTSYEYDEGDYICNKCLKHFAEWKKSGSGHPKLLGEINGQTN